MPYPIMSKADARTYLLSEPDQEKPPLPPVRAADHGPDEDWESVGAEIGSMLMTLVEKHGADGSEFEAEASPEIHRLLPNHPAVADAEFWTWLAVAHCEDVIDRRYPKKRNPKNFGVGSRGENLPYRLWLRAEVAYDGKADDEYALARFGDIDFWRSHVFRQGYGDVRAFARALIEFQFPAAAGRKARLKIAEIRELAKRLKRARSNLHFEVMSEARAAKFIENEWSRLAAETT